LLKDFKWTAASVRPVERRLVMERVEGDDLSQRIARGAISR
jgi:hypothetical protein